VIEDDALKSKSWWVPHILLVMTDDSGFGVPSTFGGGTATPTMDRIAKTGLHDTVS